MKKRAKMKFVDVSEKIQGWRFDNSIRIKLKLKDLFK
jgi:hypothetical protein